MIGWSLPLYWNALQEHHFFVWYFCGVGATGRIWECAMERDDVGMCYGEGLFVGWCYKVL